MRLSCRCAVQTLSIILTILAALLLTFAFVTPHWHLANHTFSPLGFICRIDDEGRERCQYVDTDLVTKDGQNVYRLFTMFQAMEGTAICLGIVSIASAIVFTTCVNPKYFFTSSIFSVLAAIMSSLGTGVTFYIASIKFNVDFNPTGYSFYTSIAATVLFLFGGAVGFATINVRIEG